jgi:hypothetical protein
MSTTKLFPGGFTNSAQESLGSRFSAPNGPVRVLSFTNGSVTFTGGNLAAPFSNAVTLGADNKLVNNSANKLTCTIALTTGAISGATTPPGATRSIPFKGVVFQKQNSAYGNFSGTNQTGGVFLNPAP